MILTELQFLAGLLSSIIELLCDNNVLSMEAFLRWKSEGGSEEPEGYSVAMMMLTSFFTNLEEAEDMSSGDEGKQIASDKEKSPQSKEIDKSSKLSSSNNGQA